MRYPLIKFVRVVPVGYSRSLSVSSRCLDMENGGSRKEWNVPISREAKNTINPIRHCSEIHFVEPLSKCKKKEIFKVNVGKLS